MTHCGDTISWASSPTPKSRVAIAASTLRLAWYSALLKDGVMVPSLPACSKVRQVTSTVWRWWSMRDTRPTKLGSSSGSTSTAASGVRLICSPSGTVNSTLPTSGWRRSASVNSWPHDGQRSWSAGRQSARQRLQRQYSLAATKWVRWVAARPRSAFSRLSTSFSAA